MFGGFISIQGLKISYLKFNEMSLLDMSFVRDALNEALKLTKRKSTSIVRCNFDNYYTSHYLLVQL